MVAGFLRIVEVTGAGAGIEKFVLMRLIGASIWKYRQKYRRISNTNDDLAFLLG
jgi:hypothetical protein